MKAVVDIHVSANIQYRIRLNLELYEKKEGRLGKIKELCVRTDNVSLQEVLLNTLSDSVSAMI